MGDVDHRCAQDLSRTGGLEARAEPLEAASGAIVLKIKSKPPWPPALWTEAGKKAQTKRGKKSTGKTQIPGFFLPDVRVAAPGSQARPEIPLFGKLTRALGKVLFKRTKSS